MPEKRKLIIIGAGEFAEIAFEYFTYDSEYEVAAFSVESHYLKCDKLMDLPVVPFETVQELYAPPEYSFFAAITFASSNRLRQRLFCEAKAKGFAPASYVSSRAFVWRDVKMGEHCFIFENNVVQPRVRIGDNVILWSGNHIGHHSSIGSHVFVSSHVVIAGSVQIGDYCFMGVNSTVANNLKIGNRCLVGAGALVLSDVGERKVVVGTWKKPAREQL
jgi:sugar O-acyltransferase (sialic acid O-acetyltransferase NeuD family)